MTLGDAELARVPPIIPKTHVGDSRQGQGSEGSLRHRSAETGQPLHMLFKPHVQFREPE